MQKFWKRAGMVGCLLLTLCGCSMPWQQAEEGLTPTTTPVPTGVTSEKVAGMTQKERFAQTLIKVGGLEVSYGEVILYMQSTKNEVETLYGKEVWNCALDKEGTTYVELLKEELKKQIIYTKIICAQAESLGIALTEDELMDVSEYTATYLAKFTKTELDYYGITKEQVESIYRDNLLAMKIYESLTLNVDTDISDEEARHVALEYIFLAKYRIAADGAYVTRTEEELQRLKERAIQLAEEAKTTEDFNAFAKKHTDDTDEIELTVGRGEMFEALEKVAFGLQEGEVSGLIEAEDGYFILYCKSYQDEEATEQAKIDIILERQQNAFSEKYAQWEEDTTIWVDEVLWEMIDLTGVKCE